VKPNVVVVTPNPKTSGGARLELPRRVGLRARQNMATTTPKRRDFIKRLYQNVPVLDSGSARLEPRRSLSAKSATCCSRGKMEAHLRHQTIRRG